MNKKSAVFSFAVLASLVLSGCSTEEYEPLDLGASNDFSISQSSELTTEEAAQLDTQSPQITFTGYDGTPYSLSFAKPTLTEVDEYTTHVRVAMEHDLADHGCHSPEYEKQHKEAWENDPELAIFENPCNHFHFGSSANGGAGNDSVSSLIHFQGDSGRFVYEYDIPSNESYTVSGFVLNAESEAGVSVLASYNLVTNRDRWASSYFTDNKELSDDEKAELDSLKPHYDDGEYSLTIGKLQQTPAENGNVAMRLPVNFNLPIDCLLRTEEDVCHSLTFEFGAEDEGYWDMQESSYPSDYTGEDFDQLDYRNSATALEIEAIGADKVELSLRMVYPEYEETTVYNVLTGEKLSTERDER